MSRHRNVRSMNIDEEYDGYDDVYGHSVEDDHCVSPATAAQFMYNREGHDLSSYIHDEVHEPEIPEEDEGSGSDHEPMNDSGKFQRPKLSDIEQARLNSCLEQLQNVVGEAHPEHVMVSAIMANDYDPEKAINSLLEGITGAPKPQRAPRASRRSKNTDDSDDFDFPLSTTLCEKPPKGGSSSMGKSDMQNTMLSLSALVMQHEKKAKTTSDSSKPSALQLLASQHQHEKMETSALAAMAGAHEESKANNRPKLTTSAVVETKPSQTGTSLFDLAKQCEQQRASSPPKKIRASSGQTSVRLSLADLASKYSSDLESHAYVAGDRSVIRNVNSGIQPPPGFRSPVAMETGGLDDPVEVVLPSDRLAPISLFQFAAQHEDDLKHRNKSKNKTPTKRANTSSVRESPSPTSSSHSEPHSLDSSFILPNNYHCDITELIGFESVTGDLLSGAVVGGGCFAPPPGLHQSSIDPTGALFSRPPGLRPYANFSYRHQMRGKRRRKLQMLHDIVAFDFSTPSPDDVIREKQKKAFSKNATNATAVPHLEPVPVTALKNGQKTSVITSPTSDRVADVTTGVARMTFTAETVKMKGFHLKTGENMTGNKSDGNILDTLQVQDSKRTASPRSGSPAKVDDFKRASSPAKSDDTGDNGASVSSSRKFSERRGSKQVERVDVGKEIEKRKDGKDLINLVVIGHVDAGKSTLMGHLLFQLGMVSKRNMHKYEQESKKVGKASFAYAWVLDETEEERSRGVTMDIAKSSFSTNSKNIILLDAPGHKDFIPNMITGAAQADVAVLVVNATKGEFETGFEAGGQTREHALLVRSLGVSQLVVAVNKMDTVDWSETRYQEIVKKLGAFLKQAGFKEQDLNYVPCSGFTGENLTSRSIPELSWYAGHSLVERIDRFRPPDRLVDKAFRMCVGDVFKGMGSGFCVSGRLEAGSVQTTDRLLVMPISQIANVKSIQDNEELLQCAIAGDYVTLTLTGIDMDRVTLGSILCDPTQPIYSSTRIIARVVTFNIDIPLTKGFPVVFHYQTMSEPAVIHKLVSLLNKSTGEVLKNKPRCLTKNSNAVIELALSRPVCVELYKDYKNLGRFMIRYGGATIGAGLVTKLKDVKS